MPQTSNLFLKHIDKSAHSAFRKAAKDRNICQNALFNEIVKKNLGVVSASKSREPAKRTRKPKV